MSGRSLTKTTHFIHDVRDCNVRKVVRIWLNLLRLYEITVPKTVSCLLNQHEAILSIIKDNGLKQVNTQLD